MISQSCPNRTGLPQDVTEDGRGGGGGGGGIGPRGRVGGGGGGSRHGGDGNNINNDNIKIFLTGRHCLTEESELKKNRAGLPDTHRVTKAKAQNRNATPPMFFTSSSQSLLTPSPPSFCLYFVPFYLLNFSLTKERNCA